MVGRNLYLCRTHQAVISFDMSAASAAKKKLVVCGGNGFLGSRICKAAVARDWDVTSIR